MSEAELTDWLAVAVVDGWGEEYMRTATITQMIHTLIAAFAAQSGGNIKPQSIRSFIPKFARPIIRKPVAPATDATLAWMQGMIRRRK